jgi:hypothetical protein
MTSEQKEVANREHEGIVGERIWHSAENQPHVLPLVSIASSGPFFLSDLKRIPKDCSGEEFLSQPRLRPDDRIEGFSLQDAGRGNDPLRRNNTAWMLEHWFGR